MKKPKPTYEEMSAFREQLGNKLNVQKTPYLDQDVYCQEFTYIRLELTIEYTKSREFKQLVGNVHISWGGYNASLFHQNYPLGKGAKELSMEYVDECIETAEQIDADIATCIAKVALRARVVGTDHFEIPPLV